MARKATVSRLADLRRFYELVSVLEAKQGGRSALGQAELRTMPQRGVYFFFEPGQERTDTGTGPRVVRIGTHALTDGSRSTLRQRLSQHRGTRSGGGSHRGSIFRLLVGQALLSRQNDDGCKSWGLKGEARLAAAVLGVERAALSAIEGPIEAQVSGILGQMTFLVLPVPDEPSPASLRGVIERNSIALLSNYHGEIFDRPSTDWLGTHSNRERVKQSGLWNQNHVDERYDPHFLTTLGRLVSC